jgi:putative restriction endonuclease
MKATIQDVLSSLTKQHRYALLWFLRHANTIQSWPEPLSDGTFLATRAKGIYKPAWSEYALSIRETLGDNYPDHDPVPQADGSWIYEYYQEGEDPNNRDKEYTNRGLMACCRDRLPVGVMRQVEGKPNVRYLILGLAIVDKWEDGFFHMKGFSEAEMKHAVNEFGD